MNTPATPDLNSPDRYSFIRKIFKEKKALSLLYRDVYHKYQASINRCPAGGLLLEIGSGAGFAKDLIPELISSDVVAYPNVDRIVDATRMDFPDNSLSCICLFNVLHHIPDTPAFFREAIRCLKPGGRLFMVEPYLGWLSTFIYRHFHHEACDSSVCTWEFESRGPVSDGNNALPSVIFIRDRERFCREFKELRIETFKPQMPLRYWLTGGLQAWSLLPGWAYRLSAWLDCCLISLSPRLGSFVEIELVKS